jgi:hypothetical protein
MQAMNAPVAANERILDRPDIGRRDHYSAAPSIKISTP